MYWAVLGCTGRCWAVLGCTKLYWAVLGSAERRKMSMGSIVHEMIMIIIMIITMFSKKEAVYM